MRATPWPLLLALVLLPAPARAQESVRDLGGTGPHTKFLTPGQLDRWVFEGEKGETVIAHVASRVFDPVLELAAAGDKDDKVLLEVDDPGSESRFSFRLPENGAYRIRVHAFKYQGGGNYTLAVRRFQARPLAVGQPATGTFDAEGRAFHFFAGGKDLTLIPDLKGAPPDAWKVLDARGRELGDWAGSVLLEDGGECSLVVTGPPGDRYDLLVRAARRRDLAADKDRSGRLQQGEMDVWDFPGRPGEFRLLEVAKKGDIVSRLVYAPVSRPAEARLPRPGDRPEVAPLPVASRGGRLRHAAVLGRDGRYQLQLLARTPASYELSVSDPGVPVERGREAAGSLPVGGAAFYSFPAAPGQLLQARLAATRFVPVLRLYDAAGALVSSSGDTGDGLEARLGLMVMKEGLYRLQVSSLGDGGGGDYRLALEETRVKELPLGGRGEGTAAPGAQDFWAFTGKEGQTVFLSVRSSACEPVASVRSPEGVVLAADNRGSAATGSLLALKLPRAGRYTVGISSRRGAGAYTVRLIDGD